MKYFAYFYFMKKDHLDEVANTARSHALYWKERKLPEYKGGPFVDHSGGLILFESENLMTAKDVVYGDPFIKSDLLEHKWLKEWES